MDRFFLVQASQVVGHYRPGQAFGRINAGYIKIAKRRQAILATIGTINIFVTAGGTEHFSFPILDLIVVVRGHSISHDSELPNGLFIQGWLLNVPK